MWYPPTVGPVVAEPVTDAAAKRQCRIASADTSFNDDIAHLIKVARDHVEKYCGLHFAERTITLECDSFADLAALPEAPLKSVTSIAYTDADGAQQTLSDDVYRPAGTRFTPTIELKPGQAWPATQHGSRVELVAVFGGDAPEAVQHAMLLLVGHWFSVREAVNIGNITSVLPMTVDDLLSNHRRGIYA